MRSIKILVILSICAVQISYSSQRTEIVTNDPIFLEKHFYGACDYLLLKKSFQEKFKIKKKSLLSNFLDGKPVDNECITNGQRMLFERIFIGVNNQEEVPSFATTGYNKLSYNDAFHTLPSKIKTILIEKRIVTVHSAVEAPPAYTP